MIANYKKDNNILYNDIVYTIKKTNKTSALIQLGAELRVVPLTQLTGIFLSDEIYNRIGYKSWPDDVKKHVVNHRYLHELQNDAFIKTGCMPYLRAE